MLNLANQVAARLKSVWPLPSLLRGAPWMAYVWTVVAVTAALLAQRWLMLVVGSMPPFILFYPVVLIIALIAGGGPGLLATTLSALFAGYLIIPPLGRFALAGRAEVLAFEIFVGMSLVMCLLAEALRDARIAKDAAQRESEQAGAEVRKLLKKVDAEKEWLSLVLNSITDEVWLTDVNGRYTMANPPAMREFGHPSVTGMEVSAAIADIEVLRADGSPRPPEEAPPLRALAGEIVHDEEQIVRSPRSGEWRHRQVSSAPVRDATGTIIGSVSVVRDVTEAKRAQQARREADERKNVFLATLSHELRNPLAPIRTAAKLLESEPLPQDDLRRCRGIISRQVAQMASLLDDLLDVSRIERGEVTLKRGIVELREVLDAAIETARPLIEDKQHHLSVELPALSIHLNADAMRLTQVISNLLTNAAKYSDPHGQIFVSASLEADALRLSVRDLGLGIDPQSFTRVFEMFAQVAGSASHMNGGLGIGLALAKAYVELHGGSISVNSEGLNKGSEFTVRLPASMVTTAPAQDIAKEAPAQTPGVAAAARGLEPCRVLIADDNRDAAESISMLLAGAGYQVHVAFDGAAALEVAARVHPHVAVLDIGMPGLNGYEVAQRMRSAAGTSCIRLIALTGWGHDTDKRRAESAGFDHHLTKPVDPCILERLIAAGSESGASAQRPRHSLP